jgi:hypothetical protein
LPQADQQEPVDRLGSDLLNRFHLRLPCTTNAHGAEGKSAEHKWKIIFKKGRDKGRKARLGFSLCPSPSLRLLRKDGGSSRRHDEQEEED